MQRVKIFKVFITQTLYNQKIKKQNVSVKFDHLQLRKYILPKRNEYAKLVNFT